MKIPYKKSRNLRDLISGILFGIYALNGFMSATPDTFDYLALVSSAGFLLFYALDKSTHYLTIENKTLKTGNVFPKKIPLKAVNSVAKYQDEIILQTPDKPLKIDTRLVDEKTLSAFKNELKAHGIIWNEEQLN
jgi:hypothetical protein